MFYFYFVDICSKKNCSLCLVNRIVEGRWRWCPFMSLAFGCVLVIARSFGPSGVSSRSECVSVSIYVSLCLLETRVELLNVLSAMTTWNLIG